MNRNVAVKMLFNNNNFVLIPFPVKNTSVHLMEKIMSVPYGSSWKGLSQKTKRSDCRLYKIWRRTLTGMVMYAELNSPQKLNESQLAPANRLPTPKKAGSCEEGNTFCNVVYNVFLFTCEAIFFPNTLTQSMYRQRRPLSASPPVRCNHQLEWRCLGGGEQFRFVSSWVFLLGLLTRTFVLAGIIASPCSKGF